MHKREHTQNAVRARFTFGVAEAKKKSWKKVFPTLLPSRTTMSVFWKIEYQDAKIIITKGQAEGRNESMGRKRKKKELNYSTTVVYGAACELQLWPC